jgi:hypothetical protein
MAFEADHGADDVVAGKQRAARDGAFRTINVVDRSLNAA